MFGKRIPLFRLFGFAVNIDVSWLLLAILITWSLAVGVFPAMRPNLPAATSTLCTPAGANLALRHEYLTRRVLFGPLGRVHRSALAARTPNRSNGWASS